MTAGKPDGLSPSERLEIKTWEVFDRAVESVLSNQILDESDPRLGGWILPETGWDEPSHIGTGRLFGILFLACVRDRERYGGASLLRALRAAGEYLLRARRPSGRIDLRNCNQDSGPDTAFLVQLMIACLRLGGQVCPDDGDLAEATAAARRFVREALPALVEGGIHTPNHRWVVTSALAQGSLLFPELRGMLQPAWEGFVAEGPDSDAEGAFLERSVAVYDAVSIRGLLMTHEVAAWPEGLEAARRCLEFDLDLFHPDGSVDTHLSHRYDSGSRPVPLSLAAAALMYARIGRSPIHAQQAAWIFSKYPAVDGGENPSVFWVAYEVLLGNGFPDGHWEPPAVECFRPLNRIVRVRRERWSCSLYGGTNRLLTAIHGCATLHAVMAGQTYLGHGRFVGDEMEGANGVYRLVSRGRLEPFPLGYARSLGRPVEPSNWDQDYRQRKLRRVPDCTSRITFDWSGGGDGMEILYETLDGLPDVPAQVTFDFEPGGIWETDDAAFAPCADQVIFFKGGRGRMWFGNDWLELEGGSNAHRAWVMRDYPVPAGTVRVTVPLTTPVHHLLVLRWGRSIPAVR